MSIMSTEYLPPADEILAAMPRSRDLGELALEIVNPKDCKVLSSPNFVIAIRSAIISIKKWSRDEEWLLPEQVYTIDSLNDLELEEMQKKYRFSGVQIIGWRGEMKMQITASRRR